MELIEQHLVPANILHAVNSSVKRRFFSKKQTIKQKLISLLVTAICFLAFFGVIGYAALIPGIISFLLIRWKNLEVLQFKENLIFLAAWLYASFLAILIIVYSILYEKFFRHITVIQFFPQFPYNRQVLTESTTQGELIKRDGFFERKTASQGTEP